VASAGAGKAIGSAPHSGLSRRWRSGLDARMSTPREVRRTTVTRNRGGTVTVSVRVTGWGPFTWTSSWVCVPGGTGARTSPWPGAAHRRCVVPVSVTTMRLRARSCRPDGPLPGVSRIVTVLAAGDRVHVTPGMARAWASARWPSHATARPTAISVPAAARTGRRVAGAYPLTKPQSRTFCLLDRMRRAVMP